MLPSNLTLKEIERWAYAENLPIKNILDLHWTTVFSLGYEEGRNNGFDNGYRDGYNDGYDNAENEYKGIL